MVVHEKCYHIGEGKKEDDMEKFMEEALYDKMIKDKQRVRQIKAFIEESWKDWLGEADDVHKAFNKYEKIANILKNIEAIVESDYKENADLYMKGEDTEMSRWMLKVLRVEYCQRLETRVKEIHKYYEEARDLLYEMSSRVGGDEWWQAFRNCI